MKKVLLLLVVTVLACKNEQNVTDKQTVEQQVKNAKKEFSVKMSFKTDKADMFSLVLYNIEVDEYQKKWIQINEKVALTNEIKTITANFGDNISKNLRISFGNKEEKEVEIENIEVLYGEKAIFIIPNELNKYFKFNEFVTQDTITNKLQTKRVRDKHNPIIYLKTKYLNELQVNNSIQE
jgi:hypothetical protein